MNRIAMTSTRYILGFALIILAACGPRASAQGPAPSASDRFDFGPPLRANIVFIYKYTERVTEVHEMNGQIADSTQRVLTYYISQRQIPSNTRKGLLAIEANIDSMEIDVRMM